MSEAIYFTVEQVAARLQLHAETIRRMLRDGRLSGIWLGSKKAGWRIPSSEVERLLRH